MCTNAPGLSRLLLAASVLCCVWLGCVREVSRPHIVLITADALRADHLSVNGYRRKTSPNIDEFADVAWHFTRTITVIPKTGPSFATFFTGRHPREHGVRANFTAIPLELPTLAERLRAVGYRTAAFVSNPVLRENMGFARGFDHYEVHERQDGVRRVNRAFLRWGRRGVWDRPTFVWLHYIDPHGPYAPPDEFEAAFVDDEWARSTQRVSLSAPKGGTPNKVLGSVPTYQRRDAEDRVAVYVARYDAEIRFVDHAFGEIVAFLRDRRLFDPSLVIFTSDHGESLGEHDLYFEHGWFAYEPSLHIPLMIKRPHQTQGRVVPDLVSNLDLLPTLLARVGGEDIETSGIDLFGSIGDRPPLPIESSDHYPQKFFGLRTPRWKYLRNASDASEELYDLHEDPSETRNLEKREPARLFGMRRSLDELLRTLSRRASAPATSHPADDPETLERLEALGYLQ